MCLELYFENDLTLERMKPINGCLITGKLYLHLYNIFILNLNFANDVFMEFFPTLTTHFLYIELFRDNISIVVTSILTNVALHRVFFLTSLLEYNCFTMVY